MPDIRLVSDIFSPQYMKTIRYTGKNTARTIRLVPSLLRIVFRITSSNYYEDEIKWDKTTEDAEFFGQWRVKDTFRGDARSTIWIKAKVLGYQNSKTKEGSVTIYLHPYIITKIPYDTILQKSLAFTYTHLFYKNQRKEIISRELSIIQKFEDRLKEELGLPK